MFCNYLQCAAGLCSCCGGTTCENGACNPISKQNLLVPTRFEGSTYDKNSVKAKHSKPVDRFKRLALDVRKSTVYTLKSLETPSQLTLQKKNLEEAVEIKYKFDKLIDCGTF